MTETITASYCGMTRHVDMDSEWSVVRDGVGNDSPSVNWCRISGGTSTDRWDYVERSFIVFDTSYLGNLSIKSGGIKLYNPHGLDYFIIPTNPTLNVYTVNPINYLDASDEDYTRFGSIPLSSPVLYSVFEGGDDYTFTLNQVGLANINGDGYTAFGFRVNYDVDNSPPTWSPGTNYLDFHWSYSSPNLPQLILETGDVIKPVRDWVTGRTIRLGPGYFSDELILGGLSTSWRLVELSKKPIPAIPGLQVEEGKRGPFYEFTAEGMRWFWILPDGSKQYIENL